MCHVRCGEVFSCAMWGVVVCLGVPYGVLLCA